MVALSSSRAAAVLLPAAGERRRGDRCVPSPHLSTVL